MTQQSQTRTALMTVLLTTTTSSSTMAFAPTSSVPSSTHRLAATESSDETTEMTLNGQASTTITSSNDNDDTEEPPIYYDILSDSSPLSSSTSSTTTSTSASTTVAAAAYPTLNGWYPKEDYALWGLPGAIAPTGYFDPLGFARYGLPLNDAKRLREAEVQHGRVAMVATVGYLAGEAAAGTGHAPFGIPAGTAANDQLQLVPVAVQIVLGLLIGTAELYRARRGWVEPQPKIGSGTLFTLRDSYYPGDLGFDPAGWKPTENYDFQRIQTAELSNGRLAMLGWAGMAAQELVNHRTIGATWDFYWYLWNGGNPYAYTF